MREWQIMVLLASGPTLWMVGGTGPKWLRRWCWPALVGGLLLIGMTVWWRALLVTVSLIGANTLPYGEKHSSIENALVFFGACAPAFWLGVHALPVLGFFAVMLFVCYRLSRAVNGFTWKVFEAMAGVLQAASVVLSRLSG